MKNQELKKFSSQADELFRKKNLHPEQHDEKSKIVRLFHDTFLKTVWWNHCYYGGGFEVLETLNNLHKDEFCFDKSSNWRRRVSDFIPALNNNKAWLNSLQSLVSCTMKGVGVGEMFMTLVDPDAQFSHGSDFTSGTDEYEMKKASGGCLKGNTDAAHRVIDHLRATLGIDRKKGESLEKDIYPKLNGLVENERRRFFTELYPNMRTNAINALVNLPNLKTENQRFAHGHIILKEYKNIDGWDNMALVSDAKKPVMTHIADVDDVSFLKNHVAFTPKMWRGKDTNAVGDGYATIKVIKNKS